MSTQLHIKKILKDRHLAPQKKLGQNFLTNRNIAQRIADLSGVGPDDTAIELGVGLGSLTIPLAATAHKVIGIELDAGIVKMHEEKKDLPANVHVIHQDLLKTDYRALADECGGPLKIVANLPYSITSPLIFKLIDERAAIATACLMLQKEVAQRLVASIGCKEYGILSVMIASCAQVESILEVAPGNFHPRPKVDSTVVKFTFNPIPERVKNLPDYNHKLMNRIVRAAFGQRRKTLLNSLHAARINDLQDKAALADILIAANIDPKIRAERLSLEDFVRLSNNFPVL